MPRSRNRCRRCSVVSKFIPLLLLLYHPVGCTHLCYHRQQQVARGVVLVAVRVCRKGVQAFAQLLQAHLCEGSGLRVWCVGGLHFLCALLPLLLPPQKQQQRASAASKKPLSDTSGAPGNCQ